MSIDRVLVTDDDELTREFLAEVLHRHGFEVELASDGAQAIERLDQASFDLVLTDMKMPDVSGMEVLQRSREVNGDVPVVLMTAYGSIENAVTAMKKGAFDYLVKPVSPDRLDLLIQRVVEWHALVRENRYLRAEVVDGDAREGLVTRHPRMIELLGTVRRVASCDATLLIQGESGTGKELVAHLAHSASPRAGHAFVKVNCASLGASLLEAELFGRERGAFPGGAPRGEGRFELAHGGSLLLDEVAEIPLALQAKLLRVIEDGRFERVGGTRTIKADVRLLCTTNRDLQRQVSAGRFRSDLFYRLSVVPILLPPLRERCEDIPLLAEHFLEHFVRGSASPVRRIGKAAMAALAKYTWPGNVRELRNALHRAVVLGSGPELQPADLPADVANGRRPADRDESLAAALVGLSIDEVERELILRTLERTDGNKTEAARVLRVTPRTLRNKLARYRQQGHIGRGFSPRRLAQAVGAP
ncbi:MAG: sigma-54-dependent Fis family transcriptional regulator [Candidatus Brocadiae bacterium]|nr:sigma-54-dependent Fis family transcriptional regulator [Candidatus Brocadiia bacterium]